MAGSYYKQRYLSPSTFCETGFRDSGQILNFARQILGVAAPRALGVWDPEYFLNHAGLPRRA